MVRVFHDDLTRPDYLCWNLWLERLWTEDEEKAGTYWHGLVCQAIDALKIHDWSELERLVYAMADHEFVDLDCKEEDC